MPRQGPIVVDYNVLPFSFLVKIITPKIQKERKNFRMREVEVLVILRDENVRRLFRIFGPETIEPKSIYRIRM